MALDTPLKDREITWITAYAEVREVFKHPDMLQTSYDGAKDTIFADVLVTLDGERHDLRRKTETVLFRPQIVDAL